MLNILLLSCQVEKNKSLFFNCQVKMLDTISINDHAKKIMTIYHKAFNLVKHLYKNFTNLFLLYHAKAIKRKSDKALKFITTDPRVSV
jgi:hypothetical protein